MTTALKAVTSAFTDGPGDGAAALGGPAAPVSRSGQPKADVASPAGALDSGGRDAAAAAIAAMPSAAAATYWPRSPRSRSRPSRSLPTMPPSDDSAPGITVTDSITVTDGVTPNGATPNGATPKAT